MKHAIVDGAHGPRFAVGEQQGSEEFPDIYLCKMRREWKAISLFYYASVLAFGQ
jgi:hypothetical protein